MAVLNILLFIGLPLGSVSTKPIYDPLSFRIGLMVSGLTLALAVGLLIYEWRHPLGS